MKKFTLLHGFISLSTFTWLALLSSCAVTKFRIDKVPLKKYFEVNSTFSESHTGFLVYDIENKTTLFDYNAHKHFTPASNTKLLTWYTGLKMLGDSIPSINYCEVNDSLYFSGTGDPTLLYPNFEYGNTLDFLQSFPGQLVYIQKPMIDQRFGPGWAWDDYPYYYSTEKSSFPIYGNMVTLNKDYKSDHINVIPNYFSDRLSLKQVNSIDNFSIERDEGANNFILKFNEKPVIIDDVIPFIYSNNLFIKLLSDTLKRSIYSAETFPDCKIDVLYSVPADSIYKQLLIESDNFLAEQILLVISGQLGDTLSSKTTIKFIIENQFPELKNQINWVDGSGLSRYNQLTPNALVSILEQIYYETPTEKIFTYLPKSGSTGTLNSSYPRLIGKIHAKTGSMSYVYNLSGFLETNSGKTLLFSFMNNNFNVSISELKKEIEKVLLVFINDK